MDIEVCFSEDEVAQVLWVLHEVSELVESIDALSTLALVEATYLMVRSRYDTRGQE